jgi:1-aminocyclopropane-1-carboxylate deaminase/D-cysteine desulfhydrase-like pyridoxal-dependent ACC family enzyme
VSADENLEAAAELYESAAEQLEQAAKHCRTAARHFREREVPRGAAHAWAAYGHIRAAEESLDTQARAHADKSKPV